LDYSEDQRSGGAPGVVRDGPALRFGVVLFDDEKDPRGGWAAVNGEAARRVSGVHELPTGTVWLSNMSYESFFRSTELWRNAWLRHEGYLVVKIKDILLEWGYDPATVPADFVANFCSIMFQRVMTLSLRLLREHEPNLRDRDAFQGTTLREDLRRLLPDATYPTGEAAIILRSGQAFAEFTSTTVRGQRGARQVTLRAPRLAYAADMLTAPIPTGGFNFLSRAEMNGMREIGRDRVAWANTTDKPLLLEVQIDRMEPEISAVYGFGNATDRERRIPRSWVAHPEFLALASFSDIDVKNVYMGDSYTALSNDLSPAVRRFLSDSFAETSWTCGVVAETLWRSASLGEGKTSAGKKVPPEERPHTSWRGVWIKSADKCAMFTSAMKLAKQGYDISSYGLGWIIVRVADEAITDLMRDALSIGLIPRFTDVPPKLFSVNAPIPWGGDTKAKASAQFIVSQERHMLWNLDKLVFFNKDQQGEMLKKLLATARSGAKNS